MGKGRAGLTSETNRVESGARVRAERWLRTVLGVFAPLLMVAALVPIIDALFSVSISKRLELTLLGVALVVGVYVGVRVSPNSRLVRFLVFISKNIWLWIFGNIDERKTLTEIHRTTAALHEELLFGRLADLRSISVKYYHIVYTHKGERDHIFGDLQHYRIAGFPFDEAEIIMLLWYLIASNLHLGWSNIRTICSCSMHRVALERRIVSGSFSLVGSSKANLFTKRLMDRLLALEQDHIIERAHLYTMQVDESGDCYLKDTKGRNLQPDPTDPDNPDEKRVMRDYAMLMKLPNILAPGGIDPKNNILLFAGCRVAGQIGLTQWIGNPINLANLTREYSSRFFQVILEIEYRFVPRGIPNIVATRILAAEQLKVEC
jgi:hypothetical protein